MAKTKIGQVVSYIVILPVIIALIGTFAYFTNGFTSDFKTFYVSVNGKDVMTSKGGFVITTKEPLAVEVKYTFGAFNKDENKGYSVKIVPNKTDEDFDFFVDGETHYFGDEKDISNGFVIDKQEKSFTVTPKGSTPLEILQAIYPEGEVSCESRGYNDMFTLIITSYNGEASVKLNFALERRVTGISFDKEVSSFDASDKNEISINFSRFCLGNTCRHNHGGTNAPCGKSGKHNLFGSNGRFEKGYVV